MGCTSIDTERIPSPSPQSPPTLGDTSEGITEENESPENINSESNESEDSKQEKSYPDNPRFLEIMLELEESDNEYRFQKINYLLENKVIDKQRADELYKLVELGGNEELAYELYLYEKALK